MLRNDRPAVSPARGDRENLPDKRRGYTQKFNVGGQTFYLSAREYPDGRIGEIFVDCAKEGALFRSVGNALAIAVSIGLQYGVPLQEFVDAFVGMKCEPNGAVKNHPRLLSASSFLDAIFRDLAIQYLGQDELAHVQVDDAVEGAQVLAPAPA